MTFEFKHLLPEDFSPTSRVWIYQASRPFLLSEALELEDMLQTFVSSWTTHGAPVKGYANLLFGRFIVLMADTSVSGCSTDSSVHLIKDIEKRFEINLFDRLALAFVVKEKIQVIPMSQVDYAIKEGFIDADTIYFNNIVPSKEEMEDNWMIPLADSWLAGRFLPLRK
ncbi:hypothetical protein [Dinghuibacter silviterrae]|uniref:ABC transporter ATPase n=1 Tax=Dinghuibacter silviterrae TaxID=1539049 RepID=A0A4R8DXR3_9BACT|nr:hypothetical protein [Dinghuibacter silviterrae]TDX02227.1 hypothetical protein EDB95_3281 [Dinghuibacter silviterrae]